MVSAPQQDNGAVYTFDASNGKLLLKFANADTPSTWMFGVGSSGMVIHASKNVGIVGHQYEDRNGKLTKAGAVYVFDLTTGVQIRKITPAKSAQYMYFGDSLIVSGDYLLVGARGADSNYNGRVYVFDTNADWTETTSFGPCDNQAGGRFGAMVAMSGPHFVVTATTHSIDLKGNGAVYVGDETAGVNYSKFIHMHLLIESLTPPTPVHLIRDRKYNNLITIFRCIFLCWLILSNLSYSRGNCA